MSHSLGVLGRGGGGSFTSHYFHAAAVFGSGRGFDPGEDRMQLKMLHFLIILKET